MRRGKAGKAGERAARHVGRTGERNATTGGRGRPRRGRPEDGARERPRGETRGRDETKRDRRDVQGKTGRRAERPRGETRGRCGKPNRAQRTQARGNRSWKMPKATRDSKQETPLSLAPRSRHGNPQSPQVQQKDYFRGNLPEKARPSLKGQRQFPQRSLSRIGRSKK